MAKQSTMRSRIIARLAQLRRTPLEAAELGGLERNFFDDLVKGKKQSFSHRFNERAAKGLDWTESELLGQHSINARGAEMAPAPIHIPEIDLRAGASYAGGFAQEEVTFENGHVVSRDAVRAQWGIPLIFLRDELHVHPGRVHILPIRGDSMADALFDGDRAGVDLDDVDISQGGIFAILDDNGSVIVKQVELLRDNKGNIRKILCKSRNPHYQPFELILEDPVRILGRVAFRITRL